MQDVAHGQSLPANFSWLIDGSVAGMALPRSRENLAALQALGVRRLISLWERALPAVVLAEYGLTATHIPIADFTAPTMTQAWEAVPAIQAARVAREPVAVHCAAGMGRTGTILACYLVVEGVAADAAIAQVRAARPGSIETEEQEAVVANFATTITGGAH